MGKENILFNGTDESENHIPGRLGYVKPPPDSDAAADRKPITYDEALALAWAAGLDGDDAERYALGLIRGQAEGA